MPKFATSSSGRLDAFGTFVNGLGTVSFPAGSWPTEILGTDCAAGTIWAANVRVENVTVQPLLP